MSDNPEFLLLHMPHLGSPAAASAQPAAPEPVAAEPAESEAAARAVSGFTKLPASSRPDLPKPPDNWTEPVELRSDRTISTEPLFWIGCLDY